MNKLWMIMIVGLIFGITASNVSADCAVHAKSLHIQYNELSAAEFFYGIDLERGDNAVFAPETIRAAHNENPLPAVDTFSNAQFFYGYSIPDRTATNGNIIERAACDRTQGHSAILDVSDPSLFFGYGDAGACINC